MNLDEIDEALTGQEITAADLGAALIVFVVGTVLAFVVGRLTHRYFGRPERQSAQTAKLLARIARWLVQILAIAWAFEILGVAVGWITIVLGLVIVIVVLAAKPVAESMAIGAVLTNRPAFGVGDDIEIGDFRGEVIEITARSLVLRLRDGRRVHIPNRDVLEEIVTVYTIDQTRRSSLDLTIPYAADIGAAEQVILGALQDVPGIAEDPPPKVRAQEFTEGVRLSVRFWHASSIRQGNQAIDGAVRAIKATIDKAGLQLATPQLEVEVSRDEPAD